MVYIDDIKNTLLGLFIVAAILMALCYYVWLPNPTNLYLRGIQPTLLWDLSHFFAIAFWTAPFTYLFWGLMVVRNIVIPKITPETVLGGELHLLRRFRSLRKLRGKWVKKGNLYTYRIKEKNVK